MAEAEIRKFVASDGYDHCYRHWNPLTDSPRAYIVALHGIQSHSGWYEYSSRRLCEAGYDVSFLDRRGSGLNQKCRGGAQHYERLVNDVVQFLGEVRNRRSQIAPQVPVVLLAVSWGGKLAAVTTAKRPEMVDALALLYPGICGKVKPTWYQNLQLKLAEALDVRAKRVPIPLDDEMLFTGEPKWQEYIRNDLLKLDRVTVSFLLANRELDRLVAYAARRIGCRVLVMLAGRDKIIDNVATQKFFEQVVSLDKTLFEYPKAEHTLEFEPERDQFIDDLLRWLDTVAGGFGRDQHERATP